MAWIVLNRPDAGNAMTAAVATRSPTGSTRPRPTWRCGRSSSPAPETGLLLGCRSAGQPPRSRPGPRARPGAGRRGRGRPHPRRLATAGGLGDRLREAGGGRGQRHGGRGWDAPGPGLRPGGGGRGGPLHRGLRPARHRPRRRRGLAAHPPRRDPAGQGTLLLRRRRRRRPRRTGWVW